MLDMLKLIQQIDQGFFKTIWDFIVGKIEAAAWVKDGNQRQNIRFTFLEASMYKRIASKKEYTQEIALAAQDWTNKQVEYYFPYYVMYTISGMMREVQWQKSDTEYKMQLKFQDLAKQYGLPLNEDVSWTDASGNKMSWKDILQMTEQTPLAIFRQQVLDQALTPFVQESYKVSQNALYHACLQENPEQPDHDCHSMDYDYGPMEVDFECMERYYDEDMDVFNDQGGLERLGLPSALIIVEGFPEIWSMCD